LLLEAIQALLEEALPPLADDLPWRVQTRRDLIVPQALGCVEDDPGPDDISIW
jgi:hypothetical protein